MSDEFIMALERAIEEPMIPSHFYDDDGNLVFKRKDLDDD